MPSASLIHSFPVPLGRRGTAAFVVLGLHVLLVAVLIAGLAVELTPVRITLPAPVTPPRKAETVIPMVPPAGPDQWHFTVPGPEQPVVPPIVLPGPAVPDVAPVPLPGSGPDTAAVTSGPRLLHSEEPLYPAASRRLGEQGVVLVRVLVGASGRVERLEVQSSSGYTRLDDAALAAVRRWLFQPAASGSGPVASWATLRVVFRLTG